MLSCWCKTWSYVLSLISKLLLFSYKENCKDIPKQECHTTYDKKCKDIPHEVKLSLLNIMNHLPGNQLICVLLQKCHTTYTEQCESIPKQLCQVSQCWPNLLQSIFFVHPNSSFSSSGLMLSNVFLRLDSFCPNKVSL